MSTQPPVGSKVRVTDPQALRALSHPLRLRLLGLLRLEGASTATRLGERVGESSGATSYHLRELARWGFVEEDAGRGTGRERWWRAAHRSTSWDAGDFGDARDVTDALQAQVVGLRQRVYSAYLAQRDAVPAEFADAGSLNDTAVVLRPEQARAMAREVAAVLDRWQAASLPPGTPGTALVAAFGDVMPLVDYPL